MQLNRRTLLLAGSSAGLVSVLYGCGDTSQANAQTDDAATVSPDTPAADGDVQLYDGAAVEPLGNEPIYNAAVPDHPMGGVNAEVTIVEYVSPTCPHCAAFHAQVLPQLEENFISTGQIRFIQRPFRRNVLDLAVTMVALAAGDQYNEVLGTYLDTQTQWATASNPRQAIFEIAEQFSFTQERFEEILTDEEMLAAIEATREQALNEFGLQGTPSFYINGDRYEGNYTYEALSAEIENRL